MTFNYIFDMETRRLKLACAVAAGCERAGRDSGVGGRGSAIALLKERSPHPGGTCDSCMKAEMAGVLSWVLTEGQQLTKRMASR